MCICIHEPSSPLNRVRVRWVLRDLGRLVASCVAGTKEAGNFFPIGRRGLYAQRHPALLAYVGCEVKARVFEKNILHGEAGFHAQRQLTAICLKDGIDPLPNGEGRMAVADNLR